MSVSLAEALRDLDCEAGLVAGGGLHATRGAFEFTFRRDENGVLEANFGAEVTPEEAEAFVTDLDDEYTRLIQTRRDSGAPSTNGRRTRRGRERGGRVSAPVPRRGSRRHRHTCV